jgi:hypothetical protein
VIQGNNLTSELHFRDFNDLKKWQMSSARREGISDQKAMQSNGLGWIDASSHVGHFVG